MEWYYLLTAYYLNMPGGEKKMKKNAEKEVGGSAIKTQGSELDLAKTSLETPSNCRWALRRYK